MKKIHIISILCLLLTAQQSLAQEDKDSISLTNLLNMDIEELLNTKVTIATKTEQNIAHAPSVVSVITAQEIKNMGARELSDILQLVPGFEISKNTAGNNLMGFRGVKDPRLPCKFLILMDGIRVNDIFYGTANFYGYMYDLNNIERIEIIRGPGSAVYGRNAFSAVINIISKTGITDKGIEASVETGTFNHYAGNLSYGLNKENVNFHISSNFLKSDGSDAIDPTTNERWIVDQNTQILNTNFQYKKIRIFGSFINQEQGAAERAAEEVHQSAYYSIDYEHTVNENISIQAKLFGQNTYHYEKIRFAKPSPQAPLGLHGLPEFDEYMYGFEIETKMKHSKKNGLFTGIQGDINGVKNAIISSNFSFLDGSIYPDIGQDNLIKWEPGWIVNGGHEYYNIAFYLQELFFPFEKMSITIGARYDYEDQIGNVINPRIGIVWNIIPRGFVKLMYGSAYRTPTTSQLYQILGFSLGNPNLKPERIKTYEAAFSYRFKKIATQINVFHNELKDMIYAEKYVTTDVSHTPSNRNMGENIATGIELESKIFIDKRFYAFVNYSYTESENTDAFWDGSVRSYQHVDVAPHKINAGINLAFLKYFDLNANVFYRSRIKKFFTYDETTQQYNDVSQDPLGNYAILNTTIHFSELVKGMQLSLSVFNLLNTRYYSQEPFSPYHPEQGSRQIIARVGYRF